MTASGSNRSVGSAVARVLQGCWREEPETDPGNPELEELTRAEAALMASGAGALAWWRIRRNAALATTSVGQHLQDAFRMHALHAKENEQRIIEAGQILHSGRIEALLIKGWDAARLYPKTGLRPYGDIDLVVRPADAERAEELLAGTAAGERTDLVHDVETDGCSLEELFGAAQPAEVAATAETESRMLVPSSEDRLRILSLHTLKHGAWRPLWLCDIAAGAEGAGSDFDWERCLSPDERIRDWVVTALALAGRLLGADLAGTPSAGRDVPAWLTRAVLEQWNAPFPERHGVLLEPMSRVRNPGRVPRALRRRWADPVTATISRGKRFDEAPRLPLQLADAFGRTVRFMSGSQDSRAHD